MPYVEQERNEKEGEREREREREKEGERQRGERERERERERESQSPSSSAGLLELSQFPNVYCKVSGMFATDPQWDQKSVETVVKPCLEIFGMDR